MDKIIRVILHTHTHTSKLKNKPMDNTVSNTYIPLHCQRRKITIRQVCIYLPSYAITACVKILARLVTWQWQSQKSKLKCETSLSWVRHHYATEVNKLCGLQWDRHNMHLWTFAHICIVVHDDLGWKNRTTRCNRFWRAGRSRLEYVDICLVY